jgi:hypothetical protein
MTWRARLLLIALAAACSKQRTVRLDIDPAETNFGLRCQDPLNPGGMGERSQLGGRAISGDELVACAYVDFVELPGDVVCGPRGITHICANGGCGRAETSQPIDGIELDARVAAGMTLANLQAAIRDADDAIIPDAPDGPVLIRVVLVAGRCVSPAPTNHDATKLIGCATSCPLRLDTVEGEILFGLPPLADDCFSSVVLCADPDLR